MARSSYTIEGLRGGAVRLLVGPDGNLTNLVNTLQRRVVNRAKMLSPVDSGYLRNSHRYDAPVVVGLRVTGEVRATANYAAALHDGTRAHVIVPRNGKVLRFTGRDGSTVFARRVNMPARPGRPWLLNAFQMESAALGFQVRRQ